MIEGGSSPPPQEGDEALCVWLQAWSVPEAVVLETAFTLKVGAKAADERPLAGAVIEVIDDGEAVLARGTLGEAPWPDTAALYWTEIELPAPQKAGQHTWRARLVALPQETVFECPACDIGFVAVAPPAYGLSVTVIDKGSGAPIEEAVVRWGAFRAATDAEGRASLRLPPGSEDLIVWKAGFAIPVAPLAIESDRELVIEAVLVPEENPDDFWKM